MTFFQYNSSGYDRDGFAKNGYNKSGYDIDGYDRNNFNRSGYDRNGYNKNGYKRNGYDKDGYDVDCLDVLGYDRDGYNKSGYDIDGYDRNNFNRSGYDRNGYNKNGYKRNGCKRNGCNKNSDNRKKRYNIKSESSTRLVKCPSCNQSIRVKTPLPNAYIKCIKCQEVFRLSFDNSGKLVVFSKKLTGLNGANNEGFKKENPNKSIGDVYEEFIGKHFKNNDDLVIYNGFIRGYEDSGVDIIVITPKSKIVNLVQCKYWKNKSLTVEDIESIYTKLNYYQPDYHKMDIDKINRYLDERKDERTIIRLIEQSLNYKTRKTLYIASDKVVDLAIGQYLKMLEPNIFKYKDMKMIIKEMH